MSGSHIEASQLGKNTSLPISKTIFIGTVLGAVSITAIVCGFDGLIDIKLGIEAKRVLGQVLIDGRKQPLSPPITDN
jgi:hypothetical protein